MVAKFSERHEDLEIKGTVLLVDDEVALRRAYSRMIHAEGYAVEEAANGDQALQLIREREFDVIVSDINMPGIDGVELIRLVRGYDLDVSVVLMTGQPAVETAIQALKHGALRYLVKPIEQRALVENVNQAARLRRMVRLKREAFSLSGDAGLQPGNRVVLEMSLNRALASLWIAYQPIVTWTGKMIYAYEALLRTQEERFPNPGSLLKAAEILGRVHDVGRVTRSKIATKVLEAPAECVFVNLHTYDLLDPTLFEPSAPLSQVASKVILEITERATLDDVKDARQRVANLRALGFRIAIDDMGAGYAGLTSFAQLEPDVVKLDTSLIRDIHLHPTKRKLVFAMTALCQDMGLKVVAEGVETVEERDVLIESGCDLLQGYLFARPAKPFPIVNWELD